MDPMKKELIMLWVLLTANPNKTPANAGGNALAFFNAITREVQTVKGDASWNWPGLGPANARDLVSDAVQTELAGGVVGPYVTVNDNFSDAAENVPDWSTGGNDHPSVAELVTALAI